MSVSTGKTRMRQAVGNFHDADGLHDIVQLFVVQDVTPSDLTVLVGQTPLDESLRPYLRRNPGTILDSMLVAMSTIGMTEGAGPLLVSSTPFGDRLVAAADTADSGQGSAQPFLARWLSTRHAGYLHEQLDAGAALLCIHVRNGEEEKQAGRALLQHSRHQVQMHDFSFPDPTPPV
ncbi:MAG: hypothetical protein ACRBM6_29110 [Geminicoccales bacterium]